MTWPRPVPIVGDTSTAAERAAAVDGWAFPPEARRALYDVVDARRDIRRFRPDPVPPDVLGRLLTAAHHGPSVGHSQPWRFIVVREQATRDRAALLADRERLREAAAMDPESRRQLLDLKLEGLREAPLGVVVCCDRRTPASGVLGRATYPDSDLWSCAAAIQNLWLAARAEGLGVGWVTLFRPEDIVALLGLPPGVETLGWLCIGWPDERPPEPGLQRAGWSRRQPLAEVVLEERWAEIASPESRLEAPAPAEVVAARDAADVLLTPPGSLGVLDRALDRVDALGGASGGCLVLVGADHPVAARGVSTYPADVTRTVLEAAVAGEALGTASARASGLDALVVDAGVAGPPVPGALSARPQHPAGDLAVADALHPNDVSALLAEGVAIGRKAAAAGLVVLGEVGVGNTTVAAALAAALLGLEAADVVGLGAGGDTATLDRKREAVALGLARLRSTRVSAAGAGGPAGGAAEAVRALAMLGGGEFAVLAGVVAGAASVGACVVLDGLATSVAAALAVAIEPAVSAHLVAGQRSRERAHALVLEHLGLEPLLDLRLRSGEGAGACFAAGMLLAAGRVRRETGRTRA